MEHCYNRKSYWMHTSQQVGQGFASAFLQMKTRKDIGQSTQMVCLHFKEFLHCVAKLKCNKHRGRKVSGGIFANTQARQACGFIQVDCHPDGINKPQDPDKSIFARLYMISWGKLGSDNSLERRSQQKNHCLLKEERLSVICLGNQIQ